MKCSPHAPHIPCRIAFVIVKIRRLWLVTQIQLREHRMSQNATERVYLFYKEISKRIYY